MENGLFTTLTNVNFDAEVHMRLLKESQKIKQSIRERTPKGNYPDAATYNLSDTKENMLKDSVKAGRMYDDSIDPDIRSLRSTVLYGLKGVAAYGHQARFIGYNNDQVDHFYFLGLESTTNDDLDVEDMIRMTMRTGDISIQVMKVLDEANTTRYKHPSPQKVNVNTKKVRLL